MGTHPKTIINIFKRGPNFKRNLEYVVDRVPYSYLQKIVPYSLIQVWNNFSRSHRDWLKENPLPNTKSITALPNSIPTVNNYSLNKFRLTGFKNSLIDTMVDKYKDRVHCSNAYCRECN